MAASGNCRIDILSLNQPLLVILMDNGFLCHDKARADLYGFCTQHKGGCDSPSVADSPGSNYRDGHGIRNLRNQRHGRGFADMTAGFRSFGYNRIRPIFFHSSCQCHGSHYRNNLNPCCLPHLHIFFRVSGSCGHHFNSFFDNHLCHVIGIGTHQHYIYAKRLIG